MPRLRAKDPGHLEEGGVEVAKKRKKNQGAPPPRPAKDGPFNAPFAGLSGALKEKAPPPEPPPPPRPKEPEAASEGELFAQAMQGVQPMGNTGGRLRQPDPSGARPLISREPDEDLEVLAELADLVTGGEGFDLSFTDEFVRGSWSGVSAELLERLEQGSFPVQDHLDLHGLAVDDALAETEAFIAESQGRGLRHVLLVHGRGLGSPEGVPLLKRALTERLAAKRLGKRVLGFCTAQPVDGGLGAMYVLLRKWRGPGSFS